MDIRKKAFAAERCYVPPPPPSPPPFPLLCARKGKTKNDPSIPRGSVGGGGWWWIERRQVDGDVNGSGQSEGKRDIFIKLFEARGGLYLAGAVV